MAAGVGADTMPGVAATPGVKAAGVCATGYAPGVGAAAGVGAERWLYAPPGVGASRAEGWDSAGVGAEAEGV